MNQSIRRIRISGLKIQNNTRTQRKQNYPLIGSDYKITQRRAYITYFCWKGLICTLFLSIKNRYNVQGAQVVLKHGSAVRV